MSQPQWDPNKLAKQSVTESEQTHFWKSESHFTSLWSAYSEELGSTQIYSYREVCQELWKVTGEGNGTPLQSSCLENPMDGGAW